MLETFVSLDNPRLVNIWPIPSHLNLLFILLSWMELKFASVGSIISVLLSFTIAPDFEIAKDWATKISSKAEYAKDTVVGQHQSDELLKEIIKKLSSANAN